MNKMGPLNLATCVSPNLLQTDNLEKTEEVSVQWFLKVLTSQSSHMMWPWARLSQTETQQEEEIKLVSYPK